ncbi:uncharacterized protein LOC143038456 isoform X1 [Oratosquilla oratoria]|uniref:uncharacterized protein LOC143038456 isoform X1 n=2 Tax=Oratosquilla oratoria TaxID=337810 RepID=UPI003F757345
MKRGEHFMMTDRYRTPEERYPSRAPEPDYDYTEPRHTRAQPVDVTFRSPRVPQRGEASPSEQAYLLGAASAKFVTFAILLGMSIYLEVEMYYLVGGAAAAINTFVSVGGVASIMSFIAAGANTEILHIASLALSAASAYISIIELTAAQVIYRPGEDTILALLHIIPFDVCTGVILLGIQGAIVANIRRQWNDKNSDLNTSRY